MGRCSSSTTKPLMPEATTEGTVGPPCLLSHGLNLPTDGCRAATAHTADTSLYISQWLSSGWPGSLLAPSRKELKGD